MKKRTKPVYDGAEIVTALFYLCALSTVMMYLLCRDHIVICTIIMTALSCGLYMAFYALRKRRLLSFLLFAALVFVVIFICSLAISQTGRLALVQFIYDTSDYFSLPLAAAAIVLFSSVLTYPVFYFTVKLPRCGFLLLPALAPLILAARTVGDLPGWIVALVGTGYLVATLGIARVEFPKESRCEVDKRFRKERLAFAGIVGAAAVLILLIVPRSDDTPNADYLDASRFTKTPFYGTQAMTDFTQSAMPNTGNNLTSQNILFYAMTLTPRNVISQSFDTYRGKDGWIDNEYGGVRNWQNTQRLLNFNKLAFDLKSGAENGKLSKYAEELLSLPDVPPESMRGSTMTIQINDNSNTSVVRHPSNTYNVWIAGSDYTIYRTSTDDIFTERPFGAKASYTMEYYGAPAQPEFARFMSGLSSNELSELLNVAVAEGVIEQQTATAMILDRMDADNYAQNTSDALSAEIQALADEITAGLDNDYDKALAIEKWFGDDNFMYDLNFVPQEISAEYFLFTSKRGICTDFATASVLLLRAAGIPARYTEGFLLKTDRDHIDIYGRYEVKADQAHAFATAYIPGAGWIEIDGTKYATEVSASKELQMLVFIIVAVAAVCVVLCLIFRKQLSELFFAVQFKLSRSTKKIRALYIRTRAVACRISGADPKSATSGEVCDVISRTLLLGAEAAEITEAADALIYGGKEIKVDEKRLYRNYKKIRKFSRARK